MSEVTPRARNTDPETSHKAAVSMSKAAESQREEIYQYLKRNGPETADGVDRGLGYRPTTAGRRLPELRELGLIEMLDDTGLTRSGRSARLWAVPGSN